MCLYLDIDIYSNTIYTSNTVLLNRRYKNVSNYLGDSAFVEILRIISLVVSIPVFVAL